MLFRVLAVAASIATTMPLHAAVIGDFRLDGSFANEAGGALTLTGNGGTLSATGLTFGANQGPTLSGLNSPTDLSIEFRFSLDTVSSYRKLVDFLDLANDAGLYTLDGNLSFYPIGSSATTVFAERTPATVVLTRAANGDAAAYVNGALALAFSNAGYVNGVTKIHFFRDDLTTGGNEAASGFVDYIRIYDSALSATQVAALTPPGTAPAVPEPATWAMMIAGFGFAGAAVRYRKTSPARA